MKIAIRRGHNSQATGARALIIEEVEAEKVKNSVIKYLKEAGHDVLDVSPGAMAVDPDLAYGVSKANNANVDLFVSIHFNKAYDKYNGAIGTECWTIGPGNATNIAGRITNSISSLGFKNRGVKHSRLYELKHTRMSAIIVETCFVEATKDVELYKQVGYDAIGKKIAEGIHGSEIKISTPAPSNNGKDIYRIKVDGKQIGAYSQVDNLYNVAKENWGTAKDIDIERV